MADKIVNNMACSIFFFFNKEKDIYFFNYTKSFNCFNVFENLFLNCITINDNNK